MKTNVQKLVFSWSLPLLIGGLSSNACGAPPAKPTASKPTASKLAQPRSTPSTKTRSSTRSQHTILLAQNGKALQPIVISDKASAATRAVAAELAEYLKRISGATFEVRTGDGKSGVVLGTIAQFPNPALSKPLEIKGFDGKEAFAIRTEPKRVLLIGATDLGASHAAFRFLELLGYRHFFQAPEWEVVPSIPTLRFDRNEIDRPTILARRIWYGFGFFLDEGKLAEHARAPVEYYAWSRHNRMAQSFQVYAGHAYQSIILDNKETFEQHPEYVALVNGKRQTKEVIPHYPEVQLCISNPAVRKIATAWALDFLKKNPKADMVSMEPSDGLGHCECSECKKMGSVSNRVFGLANEVAKVVAKEYPGKMVGLYAYSDHSEPPSFKMEPNVFLQLTAGFNWGEYSFDELVELWSQKCQNMGFYEYFSVWAWDYDKVPGGLAGNVPYITKQIRRYAARNAVAIDAESGNNWGPHGRGYYVANKLMWNPQTDVDALLKDFYEKAFGPAAAPMQRYYERFDPGNEPMVGVYLLGQGFRDLDEASKLAKDRPDVQARLVQLKQYMRYVHLRWLYDHETDKDKRKALTLAILTHVFRTRHSYMNHWRWMEVSWSASAAAEFNEPTWAFADPSPKPWSTAQPYTRGETENLFREGLEYFPRPPAVQETKFSTDLVPVRFKNSASAVSYQQYQNHVPYVFYSVKGEPLVMEITTSTTGTVNKPPSRYTFTDAAGKKIAEGLLPLDNTKAQRLEIKVPKPGLYYLDFNDQATGWGMKVPEDRPASIVLQRGRGYAHGGWMQPMYFYVPKGTKEIQYYWNGNTHRVHTPDGKIIREVKESGKYIMIPVPDGTDGQPWFLSQIAIGHLWFFNLPNYLAASPNALLLPREVAEKDGLNILK